MRHFTRICDQNLINTLCKEAADNPRLRTHYEMHSGKSDLIQKFLNVMQPGSYIPPHLHKEAGRWESFQIIQGSTKVLLFDEDGTVLDIIILGADSANYIVEIAENEWHAIVALEKDTVLLELKPGPYDPQSAKHFAPWAPQEGAAGVEKIVNWYTNAEVNERFSQ